jgi:hypothetical protein
MRTASWSVTVGAALFACCANAAYKCVDEKGRTHIEDTPPAACANSVIQEINRGGSVVRTIEPTSNHADKAGEAAGKAVEARKAGEQKRRDLVLLDTYGSEAEIDAARDRNLEILTSRLTAAQLLVKRGQTRQMELQPLAARNPQYAGDLERLKVQLAGDTATASRLEREVESTKAQFAADKKRWVELRSARK